MLTQDSPLRETNQALVIFNSLRQNVAVAGNAKRLEDSNARLSKRDTPVFGANPNQACGLQNSHSAPHSDKPGRLQNYSV